MKLLLVVNPISGGVNKEPFLHKASMLCEKYGIHYHIFKTTGKNDEKTLKKLLADTNPDKVVSIGGDGTTLFTGVALLNTGYPMGIIPLGSANGMATELSVDPDPVQALKDIIMSQVVAGLDLLKINDQYYSLHIGDVGINAQIVEAYEKDKNRGMATYAKYFIEELKKLNPFPATVTANDKIYSENVFMAAICNARKFGTGVPLNLEGNPMDGKFELVLVTRIDSTTLIKSGLSRFDEGFFDNESGRIISTDKAEIEFDMPRLLQLDGEVIGKFKKVHIEIIKGAIRLITHRDCPYLHQIK
jgi:diacylglycerol kinase family enzyme